MPFTGQGCFGPECSAKNGIVNTEQFKDFTVTILLLQSPQERILHIYLITDKTE